MKLRLRLPLILISAGFLGFTVVALSKAASVSHACEEAYWRGYNEGLQAATIPAATPAVAAWLLWRWVRPPD